MLIVHQSTLAAVVHSDTAECFEQMIVAEAYSLVVW